MSHTIPPLREVLVDRFVRIEDELAEFIHQRDAPSLYDRVSRAVEGIPEWEKQAAMEREMYRYRAEVEAPAAAALWACKTSRPPGVEKVVAPWSGNDDDAFCREAVEGIEPVLLRHVDPPGLSSMGLRVSWAPGSALRNMASSAFISSINHNLLALYVGKYRPCLGREGFYLVYDAEANSIVVVPPLSSRAVSMFSHGGLGTGVAILRHYGGSEHGKFAALIELLRRTKSGRPTNAATLFIWLSSSSVPCRWTQKELVLPLPVDDDYEFYADSLWPVGEKGLCWVDLLGGVLMCEDVLSEDPEFRFIELPAGTFIRPGYEGRGMPKMHRYMCCEFIRGRGLLRFVTIDGYGQRKDHGGMTLTMWTQPLIFDEMPGWRKEASFCFRELRADPTQEVPLLMPSYPVLSMVDHNVVYLSVSEPCDKLLKPTSRLLLRINMEDRQILSSFKLPPGSTLTPLYMFVSVFPSYGRKISHDQEGVRMKREAHALLPPSSGYVPRAFSDRRSFRSFPPLLEMSAPGSPGSSSLEPSTSSAGGLASLLDKGSTP